MPLLLLLAAAALASAPAVPSSPGAPEIELAGADLGAVTIPSAPDAWGGPRTGREPTLSNRVADYRLRAVLDPVKHTLDGTARLTWRNRAAVPVRSLYFHLYLNAFESEGSTWMSEKARLGAFRSGVELEEEEWGYIELRSVKQGGRDAPFGFVQPDGGPPTDRTVVRVDLPEAVPPGGTTVVDLAFFDQLPRVVARTGWFGSFHLVGQWYPKIGVLELPGERGATAPRWNCHEFHFNSEFYADFGAYDLEVVVPAGFTVGASGARRGEPETTKEGVVHRFRAEDVHDVAFTAWDGFAKPLEATWSLDSGPASAGPTLGMSGGPGSPEVKIQVLYPPEYEASAQEALTATQDSLRFYSETFGPYPYGTSTVVIPPFNAAEAAGMEYETFFTTVGSNEWPASNPGITRYVTVHEFGHGYFMGLVASNEFEEPFLDEGLNEWSNARMLGDSPGRFRPPAWLRVLGLTGFDLDLWDFERATAAVRHPADPIAGNAWDRFSGASYGSIYPRTTVVLRDLTALVGEATTRAAMRLYYERWKFRHPSTADLRQAWLDTAPDAPTREVVERWFDEQVHGATPVDDKIVSVASKEILPGLGVAPGEDGRRTELTEEARSRQVRERREAWKKEHGEVDLAKPGPFPFRTTVVARRLAAHVPRHVVVTFEDGSVETLSWPLGERWGRWELDRPVRAKEAALGPVGGYALDLDRIDDGKTRERNPGTSTRLALGIEGWARVLLAFVGVL